MVHSRFHCEPPIPDIVLLHMTGVAYVRDGDEVTREVWFIDRDGESDCDTSPPGRSPQMPTVEKVAQMQAAGYEVHQTRAHLGQAWSWRRPGATAGDTFATPEQAWTAAVPFFEEEVERARELMKHLDLKGAMKAFLSERVSSDAGATTTDTAADWDWCADGGSTWMVDVVFEPDRLISALIAAPLRDAV